MAKDPSTINDAAAELAALEKQAKAEREAYENLHKLRIGQIKREELEREQSIRQLSSSEQQQLRNLLADKLLLNQEVDKRIEKLNNQIYSQKLKTEIALTQTAEERRKDAELRMAKLETSIAEETNKLRALQEKSIEEKRLDAELRIAQLRTNLQQQVLNIETENTRSIEEIKLLADQEVNNKRLEIAKAGTAAIQEAEREAAETKMLEDEKRRLAEEKQKLKESGNADKNELKRINAQQKAIAKIEKDNKSKKRKEETQRVKDLQNSIFGKSSDDNPITLKDR